VFERFSESARRALFYARQEISERGGISIETEHLLMGLTREEEWPVDALLEKFKASTKVIYEEAAAQATSAVDKVPQSTEVPFTSKAKRALQFAAEEADRLLHDRIGPEHMILGLLREEHSVAAAILTAHGMNVDHVRIVLEQVLNEPPRQRGDGVAPQ